MVSSRGSILVVDALELLTETDPIMANIRNIPKLNIILSPIDRVRKDKITNPGTNLV